MKRPAPFARFLPLPENQSARHALQELTSFFQARRSLPPFNPLLLHGPTGTGKSHLAAALAEEVEAIPGTNVFQLSCRDLRPQPVKVGKKPNPTQAPAFLQPLTQDALRCDLFILEDLHHLAPVVIETLVQVIDQRMAEGAPMVFTAPMGPRRLAHRGTRFPNRLASRLAGGLVVALEPLEAPSRKVYLSEQAQRRQLALIPEVLDWLATRVTAGPRQLEGALTQLESLSRLGKKLDLALVTSHFGPQLEALRPTVERVAQQVGGYFRVSPSDLQSARRFRSILLPRQVGMYLARQLTGLSLEQIGAYFGGRDHTTVLHACRKVEQAMKKDALLWGAVKDLHAGLC